MPALLSVKRGSVPRNGRRKIMGPIYDRPHSFYFSIKSAKNNLIYRLLCLEIILQILTRQTRRIAITTRRFI